MCILLNVKKHEKTFALNVDIFKFQTDKYSTRNNPHKVVYSLVGISIDAGCTKVWPVTINL